MNNNFKNIQAILFVNGNIGTTLLDISKLFKMSLNDTKKEMSKFIKILENDENSPFIIKSFNDKYKLVTKVEMNKIIKLFVKNVGEFNIKLTQSMLEVLTIIAYAQPITKVEINYIRGLDSISTIQKLIGLDLINISGKSNRIGNPNLYSTTEYFLEYFNKEKIQNLPKFEEYIKQKQSEYSKQLNI